MGSMVMTIFGLVSLLLPIIVIVAYFIIKTIKGFERRADEKLTLERENNVVLRKHVEELNERVVSIERLLKEIE